MQVTVFETPETLAATAAELLATAAMASIHERGEFHIAMAGGSTPRATYELLANNPVIPWPKVHVWFGDERCVPNDNAESNYRMVREALLDRTPIRSQNVHRMNGENADREAAAKAYEASLPAAFDLVVLGMGEDGHTASLFPGSPAVGENERKVLAVTGPSQPAERLTLTPPALASARAKLILVSGANKADVLARVLVGPLDVKQFPAQLARDGIWLVDKAAAARLPASVVGEK
jgi:6-phosphogluconolactonase